MSRRSRRSRSAKSTKSGKSWGLKLFVVCLVLLLVGMGGGYLWLRGWLQSEGFRAMLSEEAGKMLDAEAEFGAFSWDGTVVNTLSFDAEGEGLTKRLAAKGLTLDIGLDKVRQQIVVLRDAKLNEVEVEIDLRGGQSSGAVGGVPVDAPGVVVPAGKKDPAWYSGLLPNEVELTGLDVGNSAVRLLMKDGPATFSGTSWRLTPDQGKGSYIAVGEGGRLTFPWGFVPPLDLRQANIRYRDRSIFLTESTFTVYKRGELKLVGEASLKGEGLSFEGSLRDVKGSEVLPEDWSQRLTGDVESDFTVSEHGKGVSVRGDVRFLNGVLTGLPVLDYLGAYGGNPRFRRLALSDASTEFLWEDGDIVLTNFTLGSEGLMRVEGQLRVSKDDRLDGRFRVGLTPGTLSRIPGAETKVFLPGERGLLWAPLRLTGTLDDPEEDLSERLIEAAGMRMFEILPETGERVLKFTQRVASGDLSGTIDQGREVIAQGSDLLEQGKILLDGEGDMVGDAGQLINQGEEVIRGVRGIFDVVRGKDPEPAPTPKPKKEESDAETKEGGTGEP